MAFAGFDKRVQYSYQRTNKYQHLTYMTFPKYYRSYALTGEHFLYQHFTGIGQFFQISDI
jgi:hypothetical protein